jgi:hypothetical protein
MLADTMGPQDMPDAKAEKQKISSSQSPNKAHTKLSSSSLSPSPPPPAPLNALAQAKLRREQLISAKASESSHGQASNIDGPSVTPSTHRQDGRSPYQVNFMSSSQHVEEGTKHDDRDEDDDRADDNRDNDTGDTGLSNSLGHRPVVDPAKSTRPLNALAQARLRREQMSNAVKTVRQIKDPSADDGDNDDDDDALHWSPTNRSIVGKPHMMLADTTGPQDMSDAKAEKNKLSSSSQSPIRTHIELSSSSQSPIKVNAKQSSSSQSPIRAHTELSSFQSPLRAHTKVSSSQSPIKAHTELSSSSQSTTRAHIDHTEAAVPSNHATVEATVKNLQSQLQFSYSFNPKLSKYAHPAMDRPYPPPPPPSRPVYQKEIHHMSSSRVLDTKGKMAHSKIDNNAVDDDDVAAASSTERQGSMDPPAAITSPLRFSPSKTVPLIGVPRDQHQQQQHSNLDNMMMLPVRAFLQSNAAEMERTLARWKGKPSDDVLHPSSSSSSSRIASLNGMHADDSSSSSSKTHITGSDKLDAFHSLLLERHEIGQLMAELQSMERAAIDHIEQAEVESMRR